ncbi:MAG TPA: hypothetical protein VFO33_04575 [Casimicrobiaceae bacterium]|nr:hypothetical protein [Casimicrobiaceae bacterium]
MVASNRPFSPAQAALANALDRVLRLHALRGADPPLASALDRLSAWQARRLRNTYADLADDPRYRGAIAFFENDLYGGGDFARRDADLARVVPVMGRLLPQSVIVTVARAVELNALSHELDRALIVHLPAGASRISVPDYCRGYRATGQPALRARQIALIGEVGSALDKYVRTPMIGAALSMMRKPAHAAGLDALQAFLERGFDAFRRMKGARDFLATIDAREKRINDAIFAGDDAPFPPP